MKQTLIALFVLISTAAIAQPTITGTDKIQFTRSTASWLGTVDDLAAYFAAGAGTVTTVSVVTANGFAGTVANATTTPAITLTTSVTGVLSGNGTAISAATTTGSGNVVLATSPTLTTPNLGTPSAATLTNATGLPISTGVSGLGTGVATFLGTPSSANLATAVTNETGTGALVFANSPVFTTPDLGTPSAATLTNATGLPLSTGVTGTLPVANGGSGAATLTGVLFGNGTSAFTGTALGGDVTLFGSNGTSPLFYSLGITSNAAAIGFSRSSSTLNLNLPNADASNRGTVSTGTQTFAGAKTFQDAVTVEALITGSEGIVGTATSSVAAFNAAGVTDGTLNTLTSTTTLDHTHNYIVVGTLTADITINLPACNSTTDGWEYFFIKKGTDAFAFILDPNASQTFHDGATTKSIYSAGNRAYCKCDNSNTSWIYGTGK